MEQWNVPLVVIGCDDQMYFPFPQRFIMNILKNSE